MTAESYCSREKFAGLKQDPAETSHEMKSGMGAQAQDFTWKNAISDYLSSIMLCKSLNSQVRLEKNHTAPATSAVWFLNR